MMRRRTASCLIIALLAGACREVSDARPSRIVGPQILALEAEPPEAAPGASVSYHVLAVDRGGSLEPTLGMQLAYCRTPKPLTDNRVASDACAEASEQPFAGASESLEGVVPSDTCALFGPNVPATDRPPDPDSTGGYYQPVRVEIESLAAVGLQRIRCPLANAPIDVALAFRDRYVANQNPVLLPLLATIDGKAVELSDIPRDRDVQLALGWPAESAERFVVFDLATATLAEQRESMRVSWFVTDGELSYDRTGRAADDFALRTENSWHSPGTAIRAHLWVVLRDSRGGTTHASYDLEVR
ncbi:MAG: hypothetical protein ACHQ53_18870 [Polyangiales bacterium]